jgi:hypothetical protein
VVIDSTSIHGFGVERPEGLLHVGEMVAGWDDEGCIWPHVPLLAAVLLLNHLCFFGASLILLGRGNDKRIDFGIVLCPARLSLAIHPPLCPPATTSPLREPINLFS